MAKKTHTLSIEIKNPDNGGLDWKFDLRVELLATTPIVGPVGIHYYDPNNKSRGYLLQKGLEVKVGSRTKSSFNIGLDSDGDLQFRFGPDSFFEDDSDEEFHLAKGAVALFAKNIPYINESFANFTNVVESPSAEKKKYATNKASEQKKYESVLEHFKSLKKQSLVEKGHSVFWESKKEHEQAMQIITALFSLAENSKFKAWFGLGNLGKDVRFGAYYLILIAYNYLRTKNNNNNNKEFEQLEQDINRILPQNKFIQDEYSAFMNAEYNTINDKQFDAIIERIERFISALREYEATIDRPVR